MDDRKDATSMLHVLPDSIDSDVVYVMIGETAPEAIPVIPTPKAHAYWVHPSRECIPAS